MTEMYQENELKLHRYRHTEKCTEKLQMQAIVAVQDVDERVRLQAADSGGEGAPAERREVK